MILKDLTSLAMWKALEFCFRWLQLMITVITGIMPIDPGAQVPKQIEFRVHFAIVV